MAVDLTLKQHDRLPSVAVTLTDLADAPADLTSSTVKFVMGVAGGTPKVTAAATIVAPTLGTVRYDWIAGDTDTPGTYSAEWQVTYANGKAQTFPSDGYNTIAIIADLDNV